MTVESITSSRQLASVGDLAAGDRSNLRGLDRRHSGRVTIKGGELHLKSLAVLIDVNHRPNIPSLQALLRYWRRQDNSVVFSDHARISLLDRISRHQPRRLQASIDDPDGPDHPTMPAFSLRRYRAVHNMFLTVRGFNTFDDFAGLTHLT